MNIIRLHSFFYKRRIIKEVIYLVLFSIIFIPSCNNDSQKSIPENTLKSAQPNVPEENIPNQVSLSKGLIKIPGIAYIDGRDLTASPPITISRINIWDSFIRKSVVCQLAHGTMVRVLTAKYLSEEDRYYFEVRDVKTGLCTGWVSEPFISSKEMQPVGDIL